MLVALALALWSNACDSERAGEGARVTPSLRVMTYNIHHGEGTDGRFDLPRIAEVIRGAGPDLVALQEVDVGTQRASGVDQATEIARLAGFEHVRFAEAIPYLGGSYGEAILSRFPIVEEWRFPLPASEGAEKRVALGIRVRPDGFARDVLFFGTHLDHVADPADRSWQSRELATALSDFLNHDLMLVGDLNAEPGDPALAPLFSILRDCAGADHPPSYPSSTPTKRIDHVLVSHASSLRTVEYRVLTEPLASDHAPIVVDLR